MRKIRGQPSPRCARPGEHLHLIYDAQNRMVKVKADDNGEPGASKHTIAYDGLNLFCLLQEEVPGHTVNTGDGRWLMN
jgi:hypothetical protein